MENYKLKKEWVEKWSIEGIIGNAVSQGMLFQGVKISHENLLYNENILIKELKKRINN